MDDDGLVVLESALEHNTSLQIGRGFMALVESLPDIKVLQEIIIVAHDCIEEFGIVPAVFAGGLTKEDELGGGNHR
jgi:hypothetical protein